MCVFSGENRAYPAEKRLVSSADTQTEKLCVAATIHLTECQKCFSLQSVRLTAGFRAAFRNGGGAELQFSAAGGGGKGAEEEGRAHEEVHNCIIWTQY